MDIINRVIVNVLTALYQPFWFSLVLAVLFMYVYKTCPNPKQAVKNWIEWFKSSGSFRIMFLLVFYTAMILFRTLLNRNMWLNPLSNVMGYWGIHDADGALTTECIENIILFFPFTILFLCAFGDRIFCKAPDSDRKVTMAGAVWASIKITFVFSFIIEFLQLFFMLGTWQVSDLVYNTAGGAFGGFIYRIGYFIRYKK